MAKQARNVRLEIAAELLKLEARLTEDISSNEWTIGDEDASDAIRLARDHMLRR